MTPISDLPVPVQQAHAFDGLQLSSKLHLVECCKLLIKLIESNYIYMRCDSLPLNFKRLQLNWIGFQAIEISGNQEATWGEHFKRYRGVMLFLKVVFHQLTALNQYLRYRPRDILG